MTTKRLSPATGFVLAMLLAAGLMAVILTLALRQPETGLRLAWDAPAGGARVLASHGPGASIPPGTVLAAVTTGGRYLRLQADDFLAEPASALPSLAAYDAFLARQDALARLQAAGPLTFIDVAGQPHRLTPGPGRSLFDLGAAFWVQVAVGVLAWLIASAVWVFRRGDPAARYLLLSGFSTLVFAPFAAVYSTRELALPEPVFRWLCDLNFAGGCLYAATMVALLWYYPRRLGRLPFGPLMLAAFALWWGAQELRLLDDMFLARRSLVLLALLGTVLLGVVQWRGTRQDPVARAALQWFLLAWLVGTSVFSALIFIPMLFGVRTDHLQGYAFLLFLLVYGGLAFGILRFRLFDLGEWWFRTLLWVVGAVVFVALDLVLLLVLGLGSALSLSLALIVCGFLWLPLRGWLWARLVEPVRPAPEELLRRVLDIALAPSPAERAARREALLRALFDPLQVEPLAPAPAAATLREDGLRLALPGSAADAPLLLGYPGGGRRLFAPRDAALADDIASMLAHADASREAWQRGAREERARIARDLHDDIGARLLAGLHQADIDHTRETIRLAITEMRTIVNGLEGRDLQLEAVLGELRHECLLRLEAAGIAPDWPPVEVDPGLVLGYRCYRHYLSMLRECVSNIVRHSGARRAWVRVTVAGAELVTEIGDDGRGLAAATAGGLGLANLRARTTELGGHLVVAGGADGTRLTIVLPLAGAPRPDSREGTQ